MQTRRLSHNFDYLSIIFYFYRSVRFQKSRDYLREWRTLNLRTRVHLHAYIHRMQIVFFFLTIDTLTKCVNNASASMINNLLVDLCEYRINFFTFYLVSIKRVSIFSISSQCFSIKFIPYKYHGDNSVQCAVMIILKPSSVYCTEQTHS